MELGRLTEIRCPACRTLLLFADGRGEIACRKCRRGTIIAYDTVSKSVRIKYRSEERRDY